ncbi:MAG TPA: GGDEF domain-containing protein [Acidimicrobiales bacterium]|nr:GGDEF domain-containing protein [Acidimicrobiales bacterium]
MTPLVSRTRRIETDRSDDFPSSRRATDTECGHHTGDEALRVVAGALRGAVRETDMVGRLGGDEFVALLTRSDDSGVARVITAFRRALMVGDEALGVAFVMEVAIGVARSQAGDTYDILMRRADRAMYLEKNWKYA